MHSRLRPDVVLVGKGDAGVSLSEFDNAVKLNGAGNKAQVMPHDNLAYIAPEQTGRIDAEIDFRTDLYSLGVIFYEMLIGKPPFETDDPLELIHCHLARIPKNPSDIRSKIPRPVSDILMRLLMKRADDRYMSAQGVLSDLVECVEQYRSTGTVTSLVLARHDRPESFKIPERLYGRAHELQQLLDAFEDVNENGSGLVWWPDIPVSAKRH